MKGAVEAARQEEVDDTGAYIRHCRAGGTDGEGAAGSVAVWKAWPLHRGGGRRGKGREGERGRAGWIGFFYFEGAKKGNVVGV